ncbi:MAG: AMP-binding protein [Rhodospirillaceae bacterium]
MTSSKLVFNDLTEVPVNTDKHFNQQTSLVARVLTNLQSCNGEAFLRYVSTDSSIEELSYKEFFLKALVTASLFDKFKVPHGATVVSVLSNPKDVFLFEAAALLTGRVPIISAHPSAKLSVNDFARTLLPLIDNAEPALIVGDPDYCSFISLAIGRRVASLEDIDVPDSLPQIIENSNPPLFIQYSSGTTGTKKGVPISLDQLLWQVDTYSSVIGLKKEDHIVSWLPFYHDMGFITALLLPLLTGTKVTLISPFDWVKSPIMLMSVISRDKGTLCWLPNFAYNFLAQAARRFKQLNLDLSELRGVVNCSEPVLDASHRIFSETFEPHGLRRSALATSYAMAETTFAITSGGFNHPYKIDKVDRRALRINEYVVPGADNLVSSGVILPGTNVKILGTDNTELDDRKVGEIVVSSPSTMSGYFKNVFASIEAQIDGFFRTGDLGYRDGEHLFVTGRLKDVIITAGRNIYPQDIEYVVNDIQGVIPGRCVVIGVDDDVRGTENLVVIAETKIVEKLEREALAHKIGNDVTALFDVALSDVFLVAPKWLKKSTSGKIARGQNKDRYILEKPKERFLLSRNISTEKDRIRKCIEDVIGVWIEDEEAPLLTSGKIDSLALTTLMVAIEEEFDKPMPMPDDVGYDAYDTIVRINLLTKKSHLPKSKPFKLVTDRRTKADYLLDGHRNFDTVILGSSRTYMLQARRAFDFGLKAFNFSVAMGKAEDYYCMANFMAETSNLPLKLVIIGVDPTDFMSEAPLDRRLVRAPKLAKYLEENDLSGQGRFVVADPDGDIAMSKQIEMHYREFDIDARFDRENGDVTYVWKLDVPNLKMFNYSYDDSRLAKHIMFANRCETLHEGRLYYFEKFIRFVNSISCELIIYSNPLHSKLLEALAKKTPYAVRQRELFDWISHITEGKAKVIETSTAADFGGYDQDYLDGSHMGRVNGDILFEYLMKQS